MPFCPRCNREFGLELRCCPECDGPLDQVPPERDELVSIYEPPDQMAALSVAALLEEHGIRASAKSEQIAMYDGLAMMLRPKWGKVLVLRSDAGRAREIVDEYLRDIGGEAAPEGGPTDDEPGED